MLRDTLDDQTLFVFDNNEFERIERISIEHEHKKTIVAADGQIVTWNPTDRIVIDRKSDTIEYTYKIGAECDVTRKYHVAQGVSNFLDELEWQNLFIEFNEKDYDFIIDNNNSIDIKSIAQKIKAEF